jgi:Mrp family chromosome partitioning ATPase
MSALDRAIIKAYAKDRPAAAPVVSPRASAPAAAPAAARIPGPAIDQLYHDGSLYRVERHAAVSRPARAIPAPHLGTLPPTSPRRGVRRSVLRLLAANAAAGVSESPSEPQDPPRVARKVIIRHISHAAAPPPLGMLRSPEVIDSSPAKPASDDTDWTQFELPPDIVFDEPEPSPPGIPLPQLPDLAPLNIVESGNLQIEVCGNWDHQSAISPLVIVAETAHADADASAFVSVQLDAIAAADEADTAFESRIPAPSFAAKSLEDREEPRIEIRIDAPHAVSHHRPHARFNNSVDADVALPQTTEVSGKEAAIEITAEERESLLGSNELTLAEILDEPLASDLAQGEITPETPPASEAGQGAKSALARWEVDRFHWPRTCEKLFNDEHGYLTRAGDKLLAAVQDGLRVLAVTGSRRGEGRSTLALCLARAAARAGIQTAVMDADFARPQLASKIAVEVAYGWQDAALGRVPLCEAAVKSVADKLTLLPLESSAATRSLSLADPRVTATIRAAAATFELLVLDMGPLAAGEGIGFPPGESCCLDAAIVVRDLRFATVAQSEAVGHVLHEAGVEAVGIAENFVIDEEIPATSV